MRTILTVALVCGALAAPAGLAVRLDAGTARQADKPSDAHGAPRPPSRWWATEKYKQELKLTAEQSAELEQIVESSMSRMKADKEDLDRAQSDFRHARTNKRA